jgi:hypothetical protein
MYYCKVGNVFLPPPIPEKKQIFSTLRKFRGRLLQKFGDLPSRNSPEQFAQMFTGRKKVIYEAAVEQYYLHGVSRRDSRSTTFVKCEKVKESGAPRCIQPRGPVYNVGVGMYLKHIEHRLYNTIQRTYRSQTPVVMKGMNVNEIAINLESKWNSVHNPVAIGLDATKFDMHVSESMLLWEHSIYEALYKGDKALARLLRWQRNNIGRGFCDDGKLTYKVKGRRFSGDMNTALGNCIIMCAMIYAYSDEKKINIQLANNGDDCVVIIEKSDLENFSKGLYEWFLQLGFRMTVEPPVYELEHVEFCQMHPVRLNRGITMVRNLETAREKDSICLFDISSLKARAKWLGAVGECGLALTGGCPVYQSMYQAYARHGKPSKVLDSVQMQSGFLMISKGLESKSDIITDEARYSFYLAFGMTPDEQVALEMYYNQLVLSNGIIKVHNVNEIMTAPL